MLPGAPWLAPACLSHSPILLLAQSSRGAWAAGKAARGTAEAPFKEPVGFPRPVATGKGHIWRFSPQNNDISSIKEKVKIFL